MVVAGPKIGAPGGGGRLGSFDLGQPQPSERHSPFTHGSPGILNCEDSEVQRRLVQPPRRRSELYIQMHRYLRAILYVLNLRTLLLCGFASSLVYICIRWRIRFAINFDIVAVGTVFPLVFGVQQAYTRRERALQMIGILKACVFGLYFCHRDWDLSDGLTVRSTLGDDDAQHARLARTLIQRFLNACYDYLTHPLTYDSLSEEKVLQKDQAALDLFLKEDTRTTVTSMKEGKMNADQQQHQQVPARLETMSTNESLLVT